MSTISSVYRLPVTQQDDLAQLRQVIEQFKAGEITAARFQAVRVPQGIYEQRENGTYMLRVRLPAGVVLPDQLHMLAQVARAYGNGQLHFTSRQDIQIHRVELDAIHPALLELADAGLSTKGGGGNTVRNITACPHAGVCPHAKFDVTPHVIGLTEALLPDTLSYQLPRKYKIAFSGCGQDCAAATVQDVGFISKVRDDVPGFTVYVGGGMGASSRVGVLLEEFIPVDRVYPVAEAIKRVFDQHGNRKNRHRARLRFLLEELGIDRFITLYREELARVPAGENALPAFTTPASVVETATIEPAPGYETWRTAHVTPQKQEEYTIVEIVPPLGNIDADQLDALADIVSRHGERTLRITSWQAAILRWVPVTSLPAVHAELSAVDLATRPPAFARMVTCAGASTCRLGICLSRGLAHAITTHLSRTGLALPDAGLAMHISGCPNACGRHPIAPIGLYGAARRVNGRLVPHYVLQMGAHVEEGATRLAEGNTAIPARNIPAFVEVVLRAFQASPAYPHFNIYLASGGREEIEQLALRFLEVPDFDEDKNPYYDWGASELFSLAGRGPGECGAGVFDLIEVDLASAHEARTAGKLYTATALAARALLVTRGEQADSHRQALALFEQHFVIPELVPAALHPVISRALEAAKTADPEAAFTATETEVDNVLAAVRTLYESMGPSLRLPAPASCGSTPVAVPAASDIAIDLTVDFRGVYCPLNYVKTKMALGKLATGQVLAVQLDGEGAKNVPASAANDGHQVVAMEQHAGHWRVLIRKK